MTRGMQALHQQEFGLAEQHFQAALMKAESFGKKDPRLALTLTSLAQAHQGQRQFVKAEPLYLRALLVMEQAKGPNDPDVAAILNNLGDELIAVMYFHGTVHDIVRMPHYHPTLAEIVTYPAEELANRIKERTEG